MGDNNECDLITSMCSKGNFIIYLLINNTNDKKYVGITKRQYLNQRKAEHNCFARKSPDANDFYRDLTRHDFTIQKLDDAPTEEIGLLMENHYIEELNTKRPNGYNRNKRKIAGLYKKMKIEEEKRAFFSVSGKTDA